MFFGRDIQKVNAVNDGFSVPEEAAEYVAKNEDVFIEVMLSCLHYVDDNCKEHEFSLGKPYIIYQLKEEQDEVYYYPIVDSTTNTIVANVGVIGTEDGYSFEIQKEHCYILNAVDYLNNDTVVYEENGIVYALTNSYKVSVDVNGTLNRHITPRSTNMNEIRDTLKKLEPFSACSQSDAEKLNIILQTTLSLKNPRGQYSYNMCWASSAATIINHLKSSSITGYDVCNTVGISYNAGGNMYNVQDGLSRYNVSYTAMRASAMTWSQITTNIDAGKPAAMGAETSSGSGHMTVLCGYNSGSSKTIVMWNPYLNSGSGGYATISFSGGVYTMNGSTYQWVTSLSYS